MSHTTSHALVERLTTEGLIGMRAAAAIEGAEHASTPTRHALRGIKLPDGSRLKLEAIRCGGRLMTSRQAVLRFLARQNEGPETSAPVSMPATPSKRDRAAQRAHAELASLLAARI